MAPITHPTRYQEIFLHVGVPSDLPSILADKEVRRHLLQDEDHRQNYELALLRGVDRLMLPTLVEYASVREKRERGVEVMKMEISLVEAGFYD